MVPYNQNMAAATAVGKAAPSSPRAKTMAAMRSMPGMGSAPRIAQVHAQHAIALLQAQAPEHVHAQ